MFPRSGHGFAEVAFTTLRFRADGRDGTIRFEASALHEVRLVLGGLRSRADAEQQLAALRARYGHEAPHSPGAGSQRDEYHWGNADTSLTLSLVAAPDHRTWFATEVWAPATPPPSWQ